MAKPIPKQEYEALLNIVGQFNIARFRLRPSEFQAWQAVW